LMAAALEAAMNAVGRTAPNPPVGAALRTVDGRIFVGHTQPPGGRHAEVMAIDAARQAGASVVGGVLATTLEPCSHIGRTPPCAHRIVAEGIRCVVVGVGDPNPLVNGQGIAVLRDAGVEVVASTGMWAQACAALRAPFATRLLQHRPYLVWKTASSLDGRIALADGTSKYLTGSNARRLVHQQRDLADAIVVGANTVLRDDPALTVRDIATSTNRQPQRFVLDPRRQVSDEARMMQPGGQRVVTDVAGPQELMVGANQGRVDLASLWSTLAQQDIMLAMIEAGPTLAATVINDADEVWWFTAPKVLGADGVPAVGLHGQANIPAAAETMHQASFSEGDGLWVGRLPRIP
jgi:diaminohydroxyphosphoribosylaminopyrimidine deaminase / 5-amino-6-(5-phosphoribosylamino)uracil reductase